MTRTFRTMLFLAMVTALTAMSACQKGDNRARGGGQDAGQAAGTPAGAASGALSDTAGADSLEDLPPIVLAPNVVFTVDDIPREGGYLKLPLGELTDAQANQFLRRVKTQYCTCGCPHTVDQCLIHDPECEAARTLATRALQEATGAK